MLEYGTGDRAVYVYHFPSDKTAFKIGQSSNPQKRIINQQASMKEEPVIDLLFWTDNAYWLEQKIHHRLRKSKLETYGNEWFDTSLDEVKSIIDQTNLMERVNVRSTTQLGHTLKQYRLQHKMTLADLSKLTGLRIATISEIENAKGNPSADSVFRILAHMHLELKVLPRTAKEIAVE